jgi:vancomycin permeability regulator SanA
MRRLIEWIFQYISMVILLFLCLAVWIVFDGLHDLGEKADVALVTGHSETPLGMHGLVVRDDLDRAIKLYNDSDISFIIVSGFSAFSGYDEPDAMVKYLESHGVPSDVIIEDRRARNTEDMARDVAAIMKSRSLASIMIVTDYYHVTGMKIALIHEGVLQIGKAHVGQFQKEDAVKICREVVALGEYIGKIYLIPAAEKAKREAEAGLEKAKVDADQTRKSLDKKLDSMSK